MAPAPSDAHWPRFWRAGPGILTLALLVAVGFEGWGRARRVMAEPGSILPQLCAKDLEASVRHYKVPGDAHVLVLTSLMEPLPISFPLAPRVLTLGVRFPGGWAEHPDASLASGLLEDLQLAAETLKARGFWAEPSDLPGLFQANDFVVTIGLASPLLDAVEAAPELTRLGATDLSARSGYPGSVWYRVLP